MILVEGQMADMKAFASVFLYVCLTEQKILVEISPLKVIFMVIT